MLNFLSFLFNPNNTVVSLLVVLIVLTLSAFDKMKTTLVLGVIHYKCHRKESGKTKINLKDKILNLNYKIY